jgi:lambda family phage portal protein
MKNYFRNVWRAFTGKMQQRSYRDVLGLGGAYQDWIMSFVSEDADLKNNNALLRERSRSLFKEDCYFRKYKEELFANVFGEEGIRLRMKCKEEADRVVYAPDEKSFLEVEAARLEKLRAFVIRKAGLGQAVTATDFLFRARYDRANATVKAGALDLYACRVIEEAYKEWQRAEFCTMTGKLNYNQVRQLRLLSCARDGDFFLRMIEVDPSENKFGFSLQLINAEWCDFNLNVATLENGNSIRMGVELNGWGKPVAYHFIKRTAWDWQFSTPGTAGQTSGHHQRIEAREIIHYVRLEAADSTRGAPWSASVIPKSRQLDKFEEAEVIAARVAACKMGFLESTVVPEGGIENPPNPCEAPTNDLKPGGAQGLPFGVTFKEWNPNHPTQNFDTFRRGMLRSWCAGLPGADYNVIANDLENINFSAGRLGRLDTNEMWKVLQRLDIDIAERPIFERWLERAMAVKAIKLPLAKFKKYNCPHFSGRRWAGVDPIKETQAAVLAITNRLMSYSRWYDDQGWDLEEEWETMAQEEMLADELGIKLPGQLEAELAMATAEAANADDEEDEPKPKKKPAAKKTLNGHPRREHILITEN